MDDSPESKGPAGPGAEPGPDDLLSIPQIARMYGINPAAARQWRMIPAQVIELGMGRQFKLFRRADVEAYANSTRRQNRLRAQKGKQPRT